jgi:RNA-splicing ligase RtcB
MEIIDREPVTADAGKDKGEGIRVFAGTNTSPDEAAISRLKVVSRLPFLAAPVVALADLHWKPGQETPSSTASATEGEIVPTLSSSSQNCGMAFVRTPLHLGDAGDVAFLDRLMTALRDEIPRSREQPVITRDEALRFAVGGAPAVAERYGIDPAAIAGIEQGGTLFAGGEVDRAAVLDALDEETLERGRISFAYIGGGNHFLEVQVVEDIIDSEAAAALGIERGGIVLMYHTGSERVGHDLGGLYGVRWKDTSNRRRKYFFRKIPLHLRGVKSPADLTRRWRYFFSGKPYTAVPADSTEGRRLLVSLRAAGNYGYANRAAVFDLILRAARRVTGTSADGWRILADLSHNVIARERIAGRDLWVHRHNAVRLRPPSDFAEGSFERRFGQLTLLPGTNRTSSYLILSREGIAATLNSADHGAGRTVERFAEAGLSRSRPEDVTLKYTYGAPGPERILHLSDEGVDEVVTVLRNANAAAPMIRTRPLAVLKG